MPYNHKHVEWSSMHVPECVSLCGMGCQDSPCAHLSRKAFSGIVSPCESVAAFEIFQCTILSVCLNFLLLQKESGEEVEVEEFYVKYKNL